MALTTLRLTNGGFTTNFQVQYEDTLANQAVVIANANALLAVIENEFTVTTGWFNTPSGKFGTGNRQVINLNMAVTAGKVPGAKNFPGANNNGYGTPINLDAQNIPGDPATAGRVQMLFMNEWVEILMSLSNGKWNAGNSMGEGLSHYCGIARFKTGYSNYNYGSFVNQWLNKQPREDWVTKTYTGGTQKDSNGNVLKGDADPISFGCALGFFYYLNVQLCFTINQILAAGAPTLAEVYKNLTGISVDPFPPFKQRLDSAFPGTATITGPNLDNPYPLWARQFGIAVPNSVRSGSPLIVFSRNPSQEEVFWIGANGDVSSTWRNDAVHSGSWHPQFGIAVPNSVRSGSPLIVLSRNPSQEEVFWIGANGDVSSTWRNDTVDNASWHPQFAIAVPGSVREDSPLVAIARTPQREDVFWIGANGDVSNTWRDDSIDGGQWHTQVGIAIPGSVRAGSPLIVFARTRETIEVFWIGANGDVSSTFLG